jgi:rhodanese-related sulfurtransferase
VGPALVLLWLGCTAPTVLPLPDGADPGFDAASAGLEWEALSEAIEADAAFYWVDVRPAPDFLLLHVKDALHVPFHQAEQHIDRLPVGAWYVVYGGDHNEPGDRVLRVLRAAGFEQVVGTALDFRDLAELGAPTQTGTESVPGGGGAEGVDSGPPSVELPDDPS